jgi:hypothetical protein
MPAGAKHIGFLQRRDFVRRLGCAWVVELGNQMLRVDRSGAPAQKFGKGRTDESGSRQILWQGGVRGVPVRAADNVESLRPVVARQFRRLVPVVHRRMQQQQRLPAWREEHE